MTEFRFCNAGLAVAAGKRLDLRNVFAPHHTCNGIMRRLVLRLLRRVRAWSAGPNLCMAFAGDAAPCSELPDGYALATAPISDAAWAQLLSAGGELGPWDALRLHTEMALLVPETQVFLTGVDAQPVACAGVYERDPESWEIGWIAVHPEHRRRGLGEAVTGLALQRAVELLPRAILLYTQDHRLGAIRLYLRLGFEPALRHRSHRRRWRAISKSLPREVAAHVVSSLQVN